MENTADRAGASKSWVRTRHKVISILLYPIIWLLVFFKYGVRPERFRGQEKGPYLILYNHQTPMDQFFVKITVAVHDLSNIVLYVTFAQAFSNPRAGFDGPFMSTCTIYHYSEEMCKCKMLKEL